MFSRWTRPGLAWARGNPVTVALAVVATVALLVAAGLLLPRWTPVVLDWVADHPTLIAWTFGLSVFLFVGSVVTIPLMIARMRADYFVNRRAGTASWFGRHRFARLLTLTVKNGLGLLLLAAGVAMLVLPGQGIITIFVAITLLNFPGKRRLELWIVRQRHVRRAIRWIRERARRPPLILPD